MNDWLRNPNLWLAAVLALALSIPVLSVALNRHWQARLLARLPTQDLAELFKAGFAPAEVLLGVPQSTLWKAWLQLLDCEGRALGKISYGWRDKIWIETDGRAYLIHEIRSPLLETKLTLDGEALCSCQRGRLGTEPSRFIIPGTGTLKVEAGLKSHFKSDYPITADGAIVGRVLETGRIAHGHAILLLKGNYSAPVRAYILALEYRRMK